jgi:hypothetical protein
MVHAPGPNAYDIFDAARAQWQLESYPQYLTYVVETNVAGKKGPLVNDYETVCYCTKGDIRVDPISTEEAQHPTTPHGINIRFNITIGCHTAARSVGRPGSQSAVFIWAKDRTNPVCPEFQRRVRFADHRNHDDLCDKSVQHTVGRC